MTFLDKIFFVLFAIGFIAFCFIWPVLRVWREQKIKAVTFKNTDSAHDYIGKIFKFIILCSFVPVILLFFSENAYRFCSPFTALENRDGLSLFGRSLMIFSLVWVFISQTQMQKSWRIGIDYERKTTLIHEGFFRFSRNPIYLGMHFSLIGLFLALPSLYLIGVFILGHILMQIQVRLEEEYLRNIHGEAFNEYCKSVRRWF
jgi:protein-S-isoprenylcysteine O-methyltransferase Ste14